MRIGFVAGLCVSLLASSAGAQSWQQVGPRRGSVVQSHTNDGFGLAVAMSGDTAIVGGGVTAGQTSNLAAAYVFARSGSSWVQQGPPLVSPNPADADFGPVAVSGNTAVVISSLHAYVFTRSGSTWTQQGSALGGTPFVTGDYLQSVALSGNTAVVGGQKAAYVFARSNGAWTQQTALIPASPYRHSFAVSVAISGDTAAVSDDDDTLHVYVRRGITWTAQGPVPTTTLFGNALSGDTLITGNSVNQDVRTFARSGTAWTQQGVLSSSATNSAFGSSVAISGDEAVVGAPNLDNGAAQLMGGAYLYKRTGSTWTQDGLPLSALKTATADMGEVGFSVAISGQTLLVGDPFPASTGGPGAYFFNRSCVLSSDCPSTAPCENGQCVAHCVVDADCADAQTCSSGACHAQTTSTGNGGAAGDSAAGAAGDASAAGSAGSNMNGDAGSTAEGGSAGHATGIANAGHGGSAHATSTSDAGQAGSPATYDNVGGDDETSSSCGCRVAGHMPVRAATFGALLVFGLAWQRRRARTAA